MPRYFVTLVVAVLVFLWLGALSRTAFGLGLQGVRDEPARMRALGFDVTLHRTLAFGIAAFVAGIAGVLSVFYNGRITPGSINLAQTIDVLIIAVIGGLYRLEGAWIGALTYALIDNYSRQWVPEVGNVLGPARFNTLIGVLFLIIVLVSPGGIIGIWERVEAKLAKAPSQGERRTGAGRQQGPQRSRDSHHRIGHKEEKGSATTYTRRDGRCLARRSRSRAAADDDGGDSNAGGDAKTQEQPAGTIKIGFLSDCEGAFGSFFEPTASGANLALIKYAGRQGGRREADRRRDRRQDRRQGRRDRQLRLRRRHRRQGDRRDAPHDGAGGRRHHGRPALRRRGHRGRQLREGAPGQDVRQRHRGRAGLDAEGRRRRTSSASTPTARSGPRASATTRTTSWAGRTAAIIGDDYSFPYTSLAGFVAEFCAIGGQIPKRVWAPLGEEDYSSYISQIPEDVDGLYVGIGGSGLISFIKQYEEQRGRVDTERMLGNVFWDDPLVLKEVGKSLVGGVTAAMTAADSDAPEVATYIQGLKDAYGDEIAGAGPSVFTYGYYTGDDRADQGRSTRSAATSPTRASCRRRWPRRR